MKKNMLLLTTAAILFCGLWFYEIFDKSDTKEQCQQYAAFTHSSFSMHESLKGHNESSPEPFLANYWHGVSNFYAFTETLRLLVGYENTFYQDCRSLYNHIVAFPDEGLSHMTELIAAMNKLGKDYTDSEGRKIISDLNYLFQYGEYPQ